MPAPFFTTNPAEFQRLEGVYIFEQNPPAFIRGVSLSTVGIYGTTVKGPVDTPVEITSEGRFKEIFGSDRHAAGGGAIVSEVWKAILNKPFGKLVVVRAAAAAAVAASFTIEGTAGGGGTEIARIDASSVGIWGNDVGWKVEDATDGNALHFNLIIRYKGETVTYENLEGSPGDNLAEVIGDDLGNNVVVTKLATGRPNNSAPSVDGADADGFTQLGQVVAGYTSVLGADGVIAATDYTAAGRALDQIKGFRGVAVVVCGNEDGTITAAVNASTLIAAQAASDRLFLIHEGALTGAPVVVATVATDAASFRDDRIIYCHNAVETIDPETALTVLTAPNSWMASILSQTDVDINPGEEASKAFTGGMRGLDAEGLTREDYITLREAGIASLERDVDGGFLFVSGVVNDLTPGLDQITRRRSADFLQLSAADRLKFFVKKKNTPAIRNQMGGELSAFLRQLLDQGRIVEEFAVDQESQNTDAQRAQGLEFILMRVRLIGHILFLVLKTEIGTGVVIEVSEG